MALITDKLPDTIDEILEAYGLKGKMTDWAMIHTGHINRTYVITLDNGEKRLLQLINTTVFKKPLELMDNAMRVTDHVRAKIAEAGGDPARETLSVYFTVDGKNCFRDSECEYWRIYNFVDNAFSYDSIENEEIFFRAGAAFGNFQSQLADFPGETLHETIASFHDTYQRFLNLKAAIEKNAAGRKDEVKAEIDFVLEREDTYDKIVTALAEKKIPLRVTHNDTKLNNILMDGETKKGKAVIDLDTVMPGSMLYDFGDSIRFGASTGAEDEKDLSKVNFDINLFKAYAEGFLSAVKESITQGEKELLSYSAYLMTMECGMRFLADYIDGDTYFATKYPEHNLVRCRTQFRLASQMQAQMNEMDKIVEGILS